MEYRFPHEIDAHLSEAVLDGAVVTLTQGGEAVAGRFHFSDGFGLVTFVPQGAWQPRPNSEVRASYVHEGRVWAFLTRVASAVHQRRWHLQRPHQITEAPP